MRPAGGRGGAPPARRGLHHWPPATCCGRLRTRRTSRALAARISANPRDFEARFGLAALQVFEGDFKAAFDNLLEVVLRDKAEGKPDRERARKQLIEWFDVCPDPDVVSHGRRYLGMYLN